MTRPECLIDIELANALNHLLYGVVGAHQNPGFRCPECHELVSPVKTRSRARPYFKHVKDEGCAGPASWDKPRRAAKRTTQL
jgi:hypothetical protein